MSHGLDRFIVSQRSLEEPLLPQPLAEPTSERHRRSLPGEFCEGKKMRHRTASHRQQMQVVWHEAIGRKLETALVGRTQNLMQYELDDGGVDEMPLALKRAERQRVRVASKIVERAQFRRPHRSAMSNRWARPERGAGLQFGCCGATKVAPYDRSRVVEGAVVGPNFSSAAPDGREPLRLMSMRSPSSPGQAFEVFRIARALDGDPRGCIIDLPEIVGRQIDGHRPDVLFE